MTTSLSGPMLPPRSGAAPKQLMVLLHGYGSDGADLISLGHHWGPMMPDMMFVSPNAPDVCDVNPGGYQWFPIRTDRTIARVEGAGAAHPILLGFLAELWGQTGIAPADTFLVGFSQGAMMALHVGLSLDQPLAGIVAFSGALVPPTGLEDGKLPKVPVCLIHGDLDTMVDPKLSAEAATTLTRLGYDLSYHRSPRTAHGISEDGLDFATSFVLAQRGTSVG